MRPVVLDADGRGEVELTGGSFTFTLRIPIVIDPPTDREQRRDRRRAGRRPVVKISRFARHQPTGYDHFIASRFGGFSRPASATAMHRAYRGKHR